MKDVILWGCGLLADLAYLYLTEDSEYTVRGFVVDDEYNEISELHSLPVVSRSEVTKVFPPEKYLAFVPMSQKENGNLRKSKYYDLKAEGYAFISYVSSKAQVFSHTTIGENCFILENNIIQHYASVGDNVIMWSGNHLGHHSSLGSHSFIASQVVISGRVTVGEKCYMGVNSCIGDDLTIADNNVIGAGALVMRSTKLGQVFVENPTKIFPMNSDQIVLK
ncbi:acetyltransferase [Marinifilum sp. JC120]|nr:acetyltransferase [Marinifilum sp. JC120]